MLQPYVASGTKGLMCSFLSAEGQAGVVNHLMLTQPPYSGRSPFHAWRRAWQRTVADCSPTFSDTQSLISHAPAHFEDPALPWIGLEGGAPWHTASAGPSDICSFSRPPASPTS